MFAGRNLDRYLRQMQSHGLGVATGQDKRGALAGPRTDGPEDVGRGRALVMRGAGPCPASA